MSVVLARGDGMKDFPDVILWSAAVAVEVADNFPPKVLIASRSRPTRLTHEVRDAAINQRHTGHPGNQ
jgi:hypothetical protein